MKSQCCLQPIQTTRNQRKEVREVREIRSLEVDTDRGERVRVKDKVDETIVAVCNRIQEKIKEDSFDENKNISHMVEALAKLISARAGLEVN